MAAETMTQEAFHKEYAANLAAVRTGLEDRSSIFLPQNIGMSLDPYTSAGLWGFHKILTAESSKLIRGGLTYTAHKHATEQNDSIPYDPVLGVAIAVQWEFEQGRILMLDDMADDDDERRGMPTVHALLRGIMEKERRDDPVKLARDFTEIVCELVGKTAEEDFLRLPAPPEHILAARGILCAALRRTGGGQGWDVYPKDRASVEQVLEIDRDKTSHYSIGGPWNMGETFGGREPSDITIYSDKLGQAFQAVNDVKGIKTPSDYLDGKITLPVAFVQEGADHHLKTLDRAFANRDRASGFASWQTVLLGSGAVEATRVLALNLTEEAVASLPDTLSLHSRQFLTHFARFLVSRQK